VRLRRTSQTRLRRGLSAGATEHTPQPSDPVISCQSGSVSLTRQMRDEKCAHQKPMRLRAAADLLYAVCRTLSQNIVLHALSALFILVA